MATIDYKQKIKDYMNSSEVDTLYKSMLKNLFPELKESEDERIKKVLIGWFKRYKEEDICGSETFNEIPTDNILAWLEKQGEHANFRNKIQIGDKVTRNEDGMLVNMSQFKRIAKKNEKQDEQKPADEAEPKFKVGDWVVDKIGTVKQILSYRDCIYKHTDGYSSKMFEDEWRLWDITKDAKEGDVLIHNECTFIFMGIKDGIVQALEENLLDGTNPVPFGEPSKDKDYYYPATKEQRDALMKAMADAGYTFDFEKKELKKIEQEHVEWSEEDEQYLLVCKNALTKYQITDKWDATIISRWLEDKLKLIKDRVGCETNCTTMWKPSDEHYELEEFAKIVRSNLIGISKAVQELFEAKYLQLTGNKMYGGYKD